MQITRRSFIAAGTAAAAGVALASPADAVENVFKARGKRIYRLSIHGRRVSNLAKIHCANFRFKTYHAAHHHHLPHPGINAKIVPVDISATEYHRLFISRHSDVADLRELHDVRVIGK